MLLLVSTLSACSVKLIADYDAQIDTAASTLQKKMDSFCTTLVGATGAAAQYNSNKTFYAEYAVDVRAVKVRASAYPKNSISIRQYDLMLRSLEDFRNQHQTDDTLPAAYINTTRDLFNTAWTAIITLEVAKKR